MSTITSTERVNFTSAKLVTDYPDFLDIQVKSFQDFFQLETKADERGTEGLFNTFSDNFPITDTRNQFILEFIDYFVRAWRTVLDNVDVKVILVSDHIPDSISHLQENIILFPDLRRQAAL